MTGATAAALAPVLAANAVVQRHITIGFRGLKLIILLVIIFIIIGVVWARRRSGRRKNMPDRPDEWPPRNPESTVNGKDDPPWR